MKKLLTPILLGALMTALPAPMRAESPRPPSGEVLEQVLVKVNGDIITKTDL